MKRACTGRKASGSPCMRSAREGEATCARCAPGYVARERKPRQESTASAVPLDASRQVDAASAEAVGATPAAQAGAARATSVLLHCDHSALAEVVRQTGGCDVLCTDAPYSSATHAGHDRAVGTSHDAERRGFDYAPWTPDDVRAFVALWEPLTRGWFLTLTDDELYPAWKTALRDAGRWVGTLIPCTERGATVRLCGGGPSSCTTLLVVARPRTPEWLNWITTESHYVVSREKKPIVGGKPVALMSKILADYSRPGELVCDPCAGGASALRAAVRLGRRAIGAEPMAEHYEIGARLLADEVASIAPDPMLLRKQPSLLDADVMRRRTA